MCDGQACGAPKECVALVVQEIDMVLVVFRQEWSQRRVSEAWQEPFPKLGIRCVCVDELYGHTFVMPWDVRVVPDYTPLSRAAVGPE